MKLKFSYDIKVFNLFKYFNFNKQILVFLTPIVVFASDLEVGFSPNNGSADLVLKTINSAKHNICIATYSFTSKPIADALMAAKERGVDIKIVSDEKANSKKYTVVRYLANHGFNVRLNGNYPIMHNKFIVVDNKTVETGSYNYSKNANQNAENVLVIWNNSSIASKYSSQCDKLFNEAYPVTKSY